MQNWKNLDKYEIPGSEITAQILDSETKELLTKYCQKSRNDHKVLPNILFYGVNGNDCQTIAYSCVKSCEFNLFDLPLAFFLMLPYPEFLTAWNEVVGALSTTLENKTSTEITIIVFNQLEGILSENNSPKRYIISESLRQLQKKFPRMGVMGIVVLNSSHVTVGIHQFNEVLTVFEDYIGIASPNDDLRKQIITNELQGLSNVTTSLPAIEQIVQQTEGLSYHGLLNLLHMVKLRMTIGSVIPSTFKDLIREYHLLLKTPENPLFTSETAPKSSTLPLLSIPLNRRLAWNDYKAHLEELLVNEPERYPDLLRAAKNMQDIDYKIRILLYDLTNGGILAEKEPYVRFTELKRLSENR